MGNLSQKLIHELKQSEIAPDIGKLNFATLSPDDCYESLLYGLSRDARRNDGRLRDGWLRKYRHLDDGGWGFFGIDLLTGEDAPWGCVKPNTPRIKDNGKPQKYEHPPKVPTEVFAPRVTRHIWRWVARRNGVPCLRLEDIPSEEISKEFWQWVKDTPNIDVLITEGAKKVASLISAGFCAVGIPGIRNGYRRGEDGIPRLIPQLQAIAQRGRKVTIALDCDSKPQTVKDVNSAIKGMGNCFDFLGCDVSVMVWRYSHPDSKGVDDLHFNHGLEALETVYNDRLSLGGWQDSIEFDLTPCVDLEVGDRYLCEKLPDGSLAPKHLPPDDAAIIGLCSAKGTGKTDWLAYFARLNANKGKRSIVPTHRRPLASALGDRFGLPDLEGLPHSQDQGMLGFSLCVDSMHELSRARFNPLDYFGCDVFVDEIEQVFWHLFTSATDVSKRRVEIMGNLQALLQAAVIGGGKIYVSDADLSPVSLELIKGLLGIPEAKTWVLRNTWRPEVRQLFDFSGGKDPRDLFSALCDRVNHGEVPIIHTGAQKIDSKWGTQTLESELKKRFPHLKILRVDAESITEPGHPAFGIMSHLDATLTQYDIVICSPTIETGVSIDLKAHFTSVWGIFLGNQPVDSVAQTLARLREDVPRYVWVNRVGLGKIGKGETTAKSLLYCESQRTKSHIAELASLDYGLMSGDNLGPLQPCLKAWARWGARINRQKSRFHDACIEKLQGEGYVIQDGELGEDSDPKKDYQAIKVTTEENTARDDQEVCDRPHITDSEGETLKRKQALAKGDRQTLKKWKTQKSYGQTVTPDLIRMDAKGGYRKLKTEYYLTRGRPYRSQHYGQKLHGLLEAGKGKLFAPDVGKRIGGHTTALALENLQVTQFLAPGKTFTPDSLTLWHGKLLAYKNDLKLHLGIKVARSPIKAANQLLKLMGRKLAFVGWSNTDGQKSRVYQLEKDDIPRDPIFDYWESQDLSKCSKFDTKMSHFFDKYINSKNCDRETVT